MEEGLLLHGKHANLAKNSEYIAVLQPIMKHIMPSDPPRTSKIIYHHFLCATIFRIERIYHLTAIQNTMEELY